MTDRATAASCNRLRRCSGSRILEDLAPTASSMVSAASTNPASTTTSRRKLLLPSQQAFVAGMNQHDHHRIGARKCSACSPTVALPAAPPSSRCGCRNWRRSRGADATSPSISPLRSPRVDPAAARPASPCRAADGDVVAPSSFLAARRCPCRTPARRRASLKRSCRVGAEFQSLVDGQ